MKPYIIIPTLGRDLEFLDRLPAGDCFLCIVDQNVGRIDHALAPDVDYVHLPCPVGPAGARNVGIEVALARGADLIGFWDDDDTIDPEYIRLMVEAIERDGGDYVTCDVLWRRKVISRKGSTGSYMVKRHVLNGRRFDHARNGEDWRFYKLFEHMPSAHVDAVLYWHEENPQGGTRDERAVW